ncbi:hypothetical protein ATCC90586_011043 [Pythium insidiosum]|nr:hypothetical protein ATCC90586_011043 [Pythium insidiosum]
MGGAAAAGASPQLARAASIARREVKEFKTAEGVVVSLRYSTAQPDWEVVHDGVRTKSIVNGVEVVSWLVHRIDDRSDRLNIPGLTKYRVVWYHPYKGMAVTWELAAFLTEFKDILRSVDRWMEAAEAQKQKMLFAAWTKLNDPAARLMIHAGAKNDCMFKSIKYAVKLLGDEAQVQDVWIEEFVANTREVFDVDLTKGVNQKIFKGFLRWITSKKGSRISYSMESTVI